MDPGLFDELARRFSQSLSRRSVTGGSLGASLLAALGLGADAIAKKKKPNRGAPKKKKTNNRGDGQNKRPGGQGRDRKRGKSGGGNGNDGKDRNRKNRPGERRDQNRGSERSQPAEVHDEGCLRNGKRCGSGKNLSPCSRCCSRFNITTRSKKKKCACRPDGNTCREPAECCAGVCDQGVCGALS